MPLKTASSFPAGPSEIPLVLYDRLLTKSGQLLYPTSPDPVHPWVSEFSGDALCVNGKVRPYLEVEPALYRFRILNAANSRFYTLSLSGQQRFHQIGSDQGLLPAPISMEKLVLAPGERADLLIDFRELAGQKSYLLTGVQPMLEFRVATRAPSKRVAGAASHDAALAHAHRSRRRSEEAHASP